MAAVTTTHVRPEGEPLHTASRPQQPAFTAADAVPALVFAQ